VKSPECRVSPGKDPATEGEVIRGNRADEEGHSG